MNIKKKYSHYLDIRYLIKNNKQAYRDFFSKDYPLIKKQLKSQGISRIRICNFREWKIWYNCCYLTGYVKDGPSRKRVFIKVMGPLLDDCFDNEYLLHQYIKEKSAYLSERVPQLILRQEAGKYSIIVSEYKRLNAVAKDEALVAAVRHALQEYSRLGIIHTDFSLSNMGESGGKYYFFDYGTSLCKDSNRIRMRNSGDYNHIADITEAAKALLPDADFYYDDLTHCGLDLPDIDREQINFIVGRGSLVCVRLSDMIIHYRLVRKDNDPTISLLEKMTD